MTYGVQFFGLQPDWGGTANEIWENENLYPNGPVYLIAGNASPNPNEYNGTISNTGAYVSNEFSPASRLKAVLGVRLENFVQRHTGRDQLAASYIQSQVRQGRDINSVIAEVKADTSLGNVLEDDKVLDALDLFPSVYLIYSLADKQNLRFSYSRTIARPSFKELSFAQIIDPVSNRIFNGGLFQYSDWSGNLEETRIDNIDLRWEMFMPLGQLLSVSAFYKSFDKPIEVVRIREATTTNEFQPRNVGDGRVFGVEFEFRKSLDFIYTSLDKFSVSGNITLVESVIDISSTELEAREASRKEGETIEDTRNMAGQAPWIVNAGLAYNSRCLFTTIS